MTRAERRRVERSEQRRDNFDKRVEQIIRADGDRCSLCRVDFQHNCRTYIGVTAAGVVALAGECCATKLKRMVGTGVYTKKQYVGLPCYPSANYCSPEQAEEAATALQRAHAELDAMTDRNARRAGVPHLAEKLIPHIADAVWKDDDRRWFESNPTRSHRLRPSFPDEFSSIADIPAPPPDHELHVLVRQVEPGMRIRHGFFRNTKMDVPDFETVLHALFDVAAGREIPAPISVEEVAELALKYADAGTLS
jgi:hypothetical protein